MKAVPTGKVLQAVHVVKLLYRQFNEERTLFNVRDKVRKNFTTSLKTVTS